MRRSLIALSESNLVQGFLLAGLLCVMPIQQLRSFTAVADPDIWWHMRVGRWILEHHSFPPNGLFSSTGATHTWAAYSWGFEVIVALLNMLLGLKGVVFIVLLFQVTLVLVFFLAMPILSGGFWWAWLLSAVAIWAMDLNRVDVGRPVAFSILFFTIEIALILWAQEIGRVKYLYWLPLLFLVWANFHIQFVYGLLLPALLGAVATVERWVAQRWAPGKADAGPQRLAVRSHPGRCGGRDFAERVGQPFRRARPLPNGSRSLSGGSGCLHSGASFLRAALQQL